MCSFLLREERNLKFKSFLCGIVLLLASFAHASQQDTSVVENPHSISVSYGVLTISDLTGAFAWFIGSFYGGDPDPMYMIGSVSVDYGYRLGKMLETGLVFNFAMPYRDVRLYTIMPRFKLNFRGKKGFINPFMEIDGGVMFNSRGAVPMFHFTLFGVELGEDYPVTLGILGEGQRGAVYLGVGRRF